MDLEYNLKKFRDILKDSGARLIAVSKTYPAETVLKAYQSGQREFGENKVQELSGKYKTLPEAIQWHLIGHLQSNKVKDIAPFIFMIHSVDSLKLLREINKEGKKNNRTIACLLQIYIASEETKFGLSFQEATDIFQCEEFQNFNNIKIVGFMGMATNTADKAQVRREFRSLKTFFEEQKKRYGTQHNIGLKELSMGMSGDYEIAIEEGSTMIRVGSAVFGSRN
jgi:pyridoxal phosphate enzyme (YggS family)